jgi:RNA polymerase sigma factor (sigma-70 family)
MPESADSTLLDRYVRQDDTAAFDVFMRRHLDLVYSAALRQTAGDPHRAQDVTQKVFLTAARRARLLSGHALISGWLHRTTRHIAAELHRAEARRRRHETAHAAEATLLAPPPAPELLVHWPSLGPLIDAALDTLGSRDRETILLRYFAQKPFADIAAALGTTEAAAQMRATRALEKLRRALAARGVTSTASALGLALGANAVTAAPASVATATLASLFSGGGASPAPAAPLGGAGPFFLMPTSIKILLGIATALALAIFALIGIAELRDPATPRVILAAPRSAPAPPEPASSTPATPAQPDGDSPLRHLDLNTYLALTDQLHRSQDPAQVISACRENLGLELGHDEALALLAHRKKMLFGLLDLLARRQPRPMLAWIASLDAASASQLSAFAAHILEFDPTITQNNLPPGPGRDILINQLRFLADAPGEAARQLVGFPDEARSRQLARIAAAWPSGRAAEALSWAADRLSSDERPGFLGELVSQLSHYDAPTTLLLLEGLRDTDAFAPTLVRAIGGLVEIHGQTTEVLELIEPLAGSARASAVEALARDWPRVDEGGMLDWLLTANPADRATALPLALAQFSPQNYLLLRDALLRSDDSDMEGVLILSANTGLGGVSARNADLIERLARRPSLATLSSATSGNAALLWRATEATARKWIIDDGGDPRAAAAWVDRLPFSTPADKATIARLIYDQWRASDEPAATGWARATGLLPAAP